MGNIFNTFLVQPLLNLLVYFYNIIPGHDVGIAIILVTVLIRLLLAPSFFKALKSQREMAVLQPKLNELREKYKENKEEQAKALMALYQEHKINPLGSCLPILIQLPILIALYRVFVIGLGHETLSKYLYSFVHNPGTLDPTFLGAINLSQPSWIFGVIAGLAQYVQSKMMLSQNQTNDPTAKALAIQTTYVFPVLTLVFSLTLPAGLPLYWIVTTLFAIGQQYYIIKNQPAKA
jgi:YidC/Oxa1 family membrane protein insertase